MAVGIWTVVDHAYMEELLGTNLYTSAAYILIATGIIVILVSFFGCMGAVKEIKCMLLTVSVFRGRCRTMLVVTWLTHSSVEIVHQLLISFNRDRFPDLWMIPNLLLLLMTVLHRDVRHLCDDAGRRNLGLRVPFQRQDVDAYTNVLFAERIRCY